MKMVYEGKDLRTYFSEGADDLLVVTFTQWTSTLPATLFGSKPLTARGVSFLAFQSLDNHWWQTEEVIEAIDKARPILSRYARIYTYGVSMGAYAALVFSGMLGAHRVIAASPQFSIHRELVPFETRWEKESVRYPCRIHDPLAWVSETAEKFILYDPFNRLDSKQAGCFRAVKNTSFVKMSLTGHAALHRFRDTGTLSRFMEMILKPDLTGVELQALAREARVLSASYRIRMAFRRYGERPKRAVRLIEQVTIEEVANDWESLLMAARIFKWSKRFQEALAFAEASVGERPKFENVIFVKRLLERSGLSRAELTDRLKALNPDKAGKIEAFLRPKSADTVVQ